MVKSQALSTPHSNFYGQTCGLPRVFTLSLSVKNTIDRVFKFETWKTPTYSKLLTATMQNVLKDNLSHKLSDKTVEMIHTLSQNREKNITPMSNTHSKDVSILFYNHYCVMDSWRRMV